MGLQHTSMMTCVCEAPQTSTSIDTWRIPAMENNVSLHAVPSSRIAFRAGCQNKKRLFLFRLFLLRTRFHEVLRKFTEGLFAAVSLLFLARLNLSIMPSHTKPLFSQVHLFPGCTGS